MRPIDNTLTYLMSASGRTRLLASITDTDRDRLWVREAARQAHLGMAGLYNELGVLESLGIIRKYRTGGAAFLLVDTGHALYGPLVSLMQASAVVDAEIRASGRVWPFAQLDRSVWPGPHDVMAPAQVRRAGIDCGAAGADGASAGPDGASAGPEDASAHDRLLAQART